MSTLYDDTPAGQQTSCLFVGKTFWFSHHVPGRNKLMAKIAKYGGLCTNIDRAADVLVADDTRGFPSPGSVSWRWIEACMDEGALLDMDRYRLGRDPKQASRAPGSSEPKKPTRTPFTEQDNDILLDWVLEHDIPRGGNVIYKELEQIHPHHTWQSWRDHWLKHLRIRPEVRETLQAREAQTREASGESTTPRDGARGTPEPPLKPLLKNAAQIPARPEAAAPTTPRNTVRATSAANSPKRPADSPAAAETPPKRRRLGREDAENRPPLPRHATEPWKTGANGAGDDPDFCQRTTGAAYESRRTAEGRQLLPGRSGLDAARDVGNARSSAQPPPQASVLPSSRPPLQLHGSVEADSRNSSRPRAGTPKRDIHYWVRRYHKDGYSPQMIVWGLMATTITPGYVAELTMESMKKGEGIPDNQKGIWTKEDDRDLFAAQAMRPAAEAGKAAGAVPLILIMGRLIEKHGEVQVHLRTNFLKNVDNMLEEVEQQGENEGGSQGMAFFASLGMASLPEDDGYGSAGLPEEDDGHGSEASESSFTGQDGGRN